MSELEIVTIRRFPNNPEIPDNVVAHIDEIEMLNWFMAHFQVALVNQEDRSKAKQEEILKNKKIYQKTPKPEQILNRDLVLSLARQTFTDMLAAMKRIAKVRVLP